MTSLGWILLATPVVLMGYAYLGYPVLLAMLGRRGAGLPAGDPDPWPELTIVLPVYNEERALAGTLDALLALDYPAERRHILVVSDASTDGTHRIAQAYAARGVHLVAMAQRGGKTAAENEARRYLQGELVVSTDATTRLRPDALKALVRPFGDPTVGVASGRDVSVAAQGDAGVGGETGYVGYEMWVRDLETAAGSIVGASGCFFAIRRGLFDDIFPAGLSRDFASPLIARSKGFRSVSVPGAVCFVPRTASLPAEFRRKVRTMTRGLETLWYLRSLMDPRRYGRFAWMLVSHKLIRWLVFLTAPLGVVGLALLSVDHSWARGLAGVGLAAALVGWLAHRWPGQGTPPRPVAIVGFLVGSHVAGFLAWLAALRGDRNPIWEPTRRA